MKKQVIIHIGVGKTGTTSIQAMCANGRDELSRRGVLYPNLDSRFDAQHILAPTIKSDEKAAVKLFKKTIDSFLSSDFTMLLISTEQFCFSSQELIESFGKLCSNLSTKIIFYARRQDDLAFSAFLQWVSQGNPLAGGFWQFLDFTWTAWNLLSRLAPWDYAFGRENICCRIFRKDMDSCLDFLGVLGLEPAGLAHAEGKIVRENQSIIHEMVPLIQLCDRLGIGKKPEHRSEFIDEVKRLSAVLKSASKPLLSQEGRRKIMSYYMESNRLMVERYNVDPQDAAYLLDLDKF